MSEEKTWSDVLSPEVQAFVEKHGGKVVSPDVFWDINPDLATLTPQQQIELLLFSLSLRIGS